MGRMGQEVGVDSARSVPLMAGDQAKCLGP